MLFRDSQVTASGVVDDDVDSRHFLKELVLEVNVLVAPVEDVDEGFALLLGPDGWEDEVGHTEINSREAGYCRHWDVHVALGDVDLGLVEEEPQLPLVLSWLLCAEQHLESCLLKALQTTLVFLQLEGGQG